MKKFVFVGALVALTLSGQAFAAPQLKHFEGEALVAGAPVTIAQAEAIALKARPGKIVKREAEKESGGSGLRYSFDIKADGKVYEVGVDAQTGAILENGTEDPATEAKETKAGEK
jgi:uncharacterized membrane protein YkoI